MDEAPRNRDELHDDLLENRLDPFLDWMVRLPGALRVVVGCGVMILAFLLGAIVWGILLEFIF